MGVYVVAGFFWLIDHLMMHIHMVLMFVFV